MSIATINKEFALSEFKRLNLKYWDLYTGDGTGMLTCQQNSEMSEEQALEVLRAALNEVSGHKVKLKASLYSREDKSKNPNTKNQIDSWVILNDIKSTTAPAGNEMIYALIEKNHSLQMQMMQDNFERKLEAAINSEKETALDRISHTVLNDPTLKFALIGLLSKFSGVPVQAPQINNAEINGKRSVNGASSQPTNDKIETIGGVPVNDILAKLQKYENENPGAIQNVINNF
jgi:hypothetical protein